jgi:hypothetical protein
MSLQDETVSSDICDQYNMPAAVCILEVKIPGAFEKWSFVSKEDSLVNDAQTGRIVGGSESLSIEKSGQQLIVKSATKSRAAEKQFICHYQMD